MGNNLSDYSRDVLLEEDEYVAYIQVPSKNWKDHVFPFNSQYYPGSSWHSDQHPFPEFLSSCQGWKDELFPKLDNLVFMSIFIINI
jgi:hypothetical protein